MLHTDPVHVARVFSDNEQTRLRTFFFFQIKLPSSSTELAATWRARNYSQKTVILVHLKTGRGFINRLIITTRERGREREGWKAGGRADGQTDRQEDDR